MLKYQNTSQSINSSTFIDIGNFSGQELIFSAKTPTPKVGDAVVKFAKSAIEVRKPKDIKSCATDCSVGTVSESIQVNFNVTSVESLDVLWAELIRVYALTKATLVHGVLPPVYSTFEAE